MAKKKTIILIIAANPKDTSRLRLDEEKREIKEGLKQAKKRKNFKIHTINAARSKDVHRALLDFEPNIIHYSGHGYGINGIAFEDAQGNTQLASTAALASLLQLFSESIECVVLNACYSEEQATAISQHIPYVIGMQHQIGDEAAIKFSVGFYDSIGAGKSIPFSYKLGCNSIHMAGIPEHLTPVLKEQSQSISSTRSGEKSTPRVDDSTIELLRIDRRGFWDSKQNTMKTIFTYSYSDSNFEAAIRTAAERVNGNIMAFQKDKEYLKLVLEKMAHHPASKNIHILLGTLIFRG